MSPKLIDSNSLQGSLEVQSDHVVFMGVYNAEPFLKKISSWLPSLDLTGTHLVISDNNSTDDSLALILRISENFDGPVSIIKNEKNFGGQGNLARNLRHLRPAKWVTTLHQDDCYTSEHVQNHRNVIRNDSGGLGMVCSEAVSQLPDGRQIPYPRAKWILEETPDAATVFLANLKNHTFPFSGATFSIEVLEKFNVPWYSTAFPDTEIVMKMCAEYKICFAEGITVTYLENPISESHSLSPIQRDFGAFQALARIFSNASYGKICRSVPKNFQQQFLESLIDGISARFQDETMKMLMTQLALEMTAMQTDRFVNLHTKIALGYSSVGDSRAVEILENLGAIAPTSAENAKHYLASPEDSEGHTFGLGHSLLLRVLGVIPRNLRPVLFRQFMKTKFAKKRFKSWDFQWKHRR
jgi:glycosyltransferase involved in cell wall biosynthesis